MSIARPGTASTLGAGGVEARACSGCGAGAVEVFLEQAAIPLTSNRLFATRAAALACARGEMRLGFCHACGLVSNVAFGASAVVEDYESSQAASSQFRNYATGLARQWMDRHGLRGQTVLEVGCGRGEFLDVMVAEGGGRGIGVDPVLAAGPARPHDRIEWVAERFEAAHLREDVRAVVCRHTLEHLPDPAAFLGTVRAAIGTRNVPLLLEVPDALPILRDAAFWDVYHEHAAYFTAGSLARLLHASGFEVRRMEHSYGRQYLVAEAVPARGGVLGRTAEDDRAETWRAAISFREAYTRRIHALRESFEAASARGERIAFWGAGSKATAYLIAVGEAGRLVQCVVDINPRKQGSFIAGTGHAVVGPEHLREVSPDVVVMMNPIYRDEIARTLGGLGLSVRLVDAGAA
ncbi:MAG: class I SAM-dependent methyltransferase [Dehalococcoidia bacterium]|nr:class I SAM-dependent methyltransferase [Dehalococcoidia bacterium]